MMLEQCNGCTKIINDSCQMYGDRAKDQWSRLGGCAGRTHNRSIQMDQTDGKGFKLNPLKQSKRSMGR